jgi:type 1 fimbria pilin
MPEGLPCADRTDRHSGTDRTADGTQATNGTATALSGGPVARAGVGLELCASLGLPLLTGRGMEWIVQRWSTNAP